VQGKTDSKVPTVAGRIVRRRARTRQALLDAAETLFAAQGVDAVSIDEIANRADVAKGTFYNYFTDKDTLARELSDATRLDLEAAIARLNDRIDDPAMRVARAFCCVLRFGLDHPDRARAMMRMHPHATDPDAPTNAGVRADMRCGLAGRRFAAPSEVAAMILVVGVVQAGLSRALDLLDAAAVARLGHELGLLLLRGLGLSPHDAAAVMTAALDAVFDQAVSAPNN
jgi:AcrR family transcriptional regulator